MCANDTNVTFVASNMVDLETQINNELSSSSQKLQSLNEYTIDINVDGVKINKTNHSKVLGLNIDENLFWKQHIRELSKKVASSISALKRVRPFIPLNTAIKIYKGLLEPHFHYCSVVWHGLSQELNEKLQ